MSSLRRTVALCAALLLAGCATLPEPLNVTVAGIDPLPGEGLEVRMLVKLRLQNPNDKVVDYKGASVKMSVANRAFATGVSDTAGTLPSLGETVVEVPVTISALNIVRQVLGVMNGQPVDKVAYSMAGKLYTGGLGGLPFGTDGVLELPKQAGP